MNQILWPFIYFCLPPELAMIFQAFYVLQRDSSPIDFNFIILY